MLADGFSDEPLDITPINQQLSATVVTLWVKFVTPLSAELEPEASGIPDCFTPVYEAAPTLNQLVTEPVSVTAILFAPVAGANKYQSSTSLELFGLTSSIIFVRATPL